MSIDILRASKHLQDGGFNDSQAEAILNLFNNVQDEVATKADINRLEAATKLAFAELEYNRKRAEREVTFQQLIDDLKWLKWMYAVNLATTIAACATIILFITNQ